MNILFNLIIGAVVAFIAKYILEALGVPSPFPMLVALLAFIVVAFGGSRDINL